MSPEARRLTAAVGVMLVAGLLSGCAAGAGGATAHGTPVAVGDIQSVAGRWSGVMELSGRRHEDFVEVVIGPEGTYQMHGARTVGMLEAQGRVEAAGGTLRFEGPRTAATGTLYTKDARRTLVIEGRSERGGRVTLRLHPAR